jgi:hypothetical protein
MLRPYSFQKAQGAQVAKKTSEQATVTIERVISAPRGIPCGTKLIARNPDGTIARMGTRRVDPRDVTDIWMEKLLEIDDRDADKRTRIELLFDSLFTCATTGLDDPKNRMPAVKANEILMTRVLGKPSPAPETLEALQQGAGVKVIIVQAPPVQKKELRNPDQKVLPEFAESEVVKTNE